MTTSPFDDIRDLIANVPGPDESARRAVRERLHARQSGGGGLGRLQGAAEWLAAWQGKATPSVDRPLVCLFAASHGVSRHEAPGRVGSTSLDSFAAGTAVINQVCSAYGLGFKVFDLAVDLPTEDILSRPAMDERACVATMAFGMESLAGGTDLLAIAAAGQGSDLVAAMISAALYGGPAQEWLRTAPSTAQESTPSGAELVEQALRRHAGSLGDPLHILQILGGRDIAAMVGAILAARLQQIPIVLDDFASASAAAVLHAVDPEATAHCLAGHAEPGGAHARVLDRIGATPLLSLGISAGEGIGAALAVGILKAAAACCREPAPAIAPPTLTH